MSQDEPVMFGFISSPAASAYSYSVMASSLVLQRHWWDSAGPCFCSRICAWGCLHVCSSLLKL